MFILMEYHGRYIIINTDFINLRIKINQDLRIYDYFLTIMEYR